MKSMMKFSAIASALAVLTVSAAADDPQWRNLLALKRAENPEMARSATTIAVYTGERGVGHVTTTEARHERRLVVRQDPHSQYIPLWVQAH